MAGVRNCKTREVPRIIPQIPVVHENLTLIIRRGIVHVIAIVTWQQKTLPNKSSNCNCCFSTMGNRGTCENYFSRAFAM